MGWCLRERERQRGRVHWRPAVWADIDLRTSSFCPVLWCVVCACPFRHSHSAMPYPGGSSSNLHVNLHAFMYVSVWIVSRWFSSTLGGERCVFVGILYVSAISTEGGPCIYH